MLNPLLPRRADNGYRGPRLALWIFGLLALVRTGIGLGVILNGYNAATSADGIPLDTLSPAGVQIVLSLLALVGVANLVLALLSIVVLLRYRTLVSLMFLLLLIYHVGRYIILYFIPIPRTGAPPGSVINLAMLALLIVGLALSLWNRDGLRAGE